MSVNFNNIKNYKAPSSTYKDEADKKRLDETIDKLGKVKIKEVAKEQKDYEKGKKRLSKLKIALTIAGVTAATAILVASIATFILGTLSTGGLALGILAGVVVLLGTFKDLYSPVNSFSDTLKKDKKISKHGSTAVKKDMQTADELMKRRLETLKEIKSERKHIEALVKAKEKNQDFKVAYEKKMGPVKMIFESQISDDEWEKMSKRYDELTATEQDIHNQREMLNKKKEEFRIELGKENASYFLPV